MYQRLSLSIVTPAYNRKELLLRILDNINLWDTSKTEVEWIIVDDGSCEPISDFIPKESNNGVNISVIRKENGGKHTALNYGFSIVSNEFCLILDSDDFITAYQFNNIKNAYSFIRSRNIDGVVSYNINVKTNEKHGDLFESKIIDETRVFSLKGDFCRIFRSSIIKNYRLPIIDEEKFMVEALLWIHVHKNGIMETYNSDLVSIDFQSTGLSSSYGQLCKSNPNGIIHTITEISKIGIMHNKNVYKFCLYHISRLESVIGSLLTMKIRLIDKLLLSVALIIKRVR